MGQEAAGIWTIQADSSPRGVVSDWLQGTAGDEGFRFRASLDLLRFALIPCFRSTLKVVLCNFSAAFVEWVTSRRPIFGRDLPI